MTDVRIDLGDLQFYGNPAEFDVPCGIHCTKKQARRKYLEYVGPLKVVLLDTPAVIYREQLWGSAFIKFTYFAMGVTVSFIALYATAYLETKKVTNAHILLCTFGYQLCLPVSFLLTNPIDPNTVWMTSTHRIVDSAILRVFGFLLIFISMAVMALFGGFLMPSGYDVHVLSGVAAIGATGMDFLCLCCAYHIYASKFWKLFSIPAVILGTITFCSGLLKGKIQSWFPIHETVYLLMSLSAMYTLVCIFRPLRDCLFVWRKYT